MVLETLKAWFGAVDPETLNAILRAFVWGSVEGLMGVSYFLIITNPNWPQWKAEKKAWLINLIAKVLGWVRIK